MEHTTSTPNTINSKWVSMAALAIASASFILSSVKWHHAFFAWVGPLALLYFFRIGNLKRKLLLFLPVMILTELVSSFDVAPFPFIVLFILSVIATIKYAVIFLFDRWITRKTHHFAITLVFPVILVAKEYWEITGGTGAWWSVANSQFSFSWLIQLASVTGLSGISFIIYWLASVAVWAIENQRQKRSSLTGLLIFGTVFFAILSFGAIRYNYSAANTQKTVRIAGLSVPLMGVMESIYKDFCGKQVTIDLHSSLTSTQLQEVNRAEIPFLETADRKRFANGVAAIQKANDSLFNLSKIAAEQGADIITWSEANALLFKNEESEFIERGKAFASKHKVYLLMTLAVIHPGRILPETKFLENEAVFVDPGGTVLNIFHKNNPVPMAEASVPGNGIIPTIKTPFGNIATSICYDADFPVQMRQLGKNQTDILLLPSGDWYAIAPHHSYMAVFRGIENGCTIVRQASGGLSLVTDRKGRIISQLDFFKPGTKLWMATIPAEHMVTIYSRIGDLLPITCVVVSLSLVMYSLVFFLVELIKRRKGMNTRQVMSALYF